MRKLPLVVAPLATVVAVGVALLVGATPASAKGPMAATVEVAGHTPIEVDWSVDEDGFADLIDTMAYFAGMGAMTPSPPPSAEPPPGDLGPAVVVTWWAGQSVATDGTTTRDAGPVTYVAAGQATYDVALTTSQWYRHRGDLAGALDRLGVPRPAGAPAAPPSTTTTAAPTTEPTPVAADRIAAATGTGDTVADDPTGPGVGPWALAAGGIALAGTGTALAVRRRTRPARAEHPGRPAAA